jgi:PAS domain S-box-containing protein
MPAHRSVWLLSTINAVREIMVERLQKHSLEPEAEREMQMALDAIEVMWEELVGQADLLAREHKRYQEFFEFSPDAYAITDVGGNVREANQALADLLKVPRADLLGKPLSGYVLEAERATFLSNLVGMAMHVEAKPLTWRSRLRTLEGAAIDALISIRAMPLRRSGVGGLCWLFRPI